jgi:nitrous oxidase accessory protein NosD
MAWSHQSKVNISHNTFSFSYNIGIGVELYNTVESIIYKNSFLNLKGIELDYSGIANSMTRNDIIDNLFVNCEVGVLVAQSYFQYPCEVRGNTFKNNSIGLAVQFAPGLFWKNNFIDNQVACKFEKFPKDSVIFQSNFWGRARLFPKIIFGYIGFFILFPTVHIDWSPLKQPYDNGWN